MSRPSLSILGCLSIVSLAFLAGCPSKGDGEASASARPEPSNVIERTCKDAGARYGEHLGKTLLVDPIRPVPPEMQEKTKAAIKASVVRSCEEDKWEMAPLECFGTVFANPEAAGGQLDDALSKCARGVGTEKTTKLNERLAHALVYGDDEPPTSAAPSAAP